MANSGADTDVAGALWGAAPRFSPPPPGAVAGLSELWRDVEDATAERGASCRACGRCCDFPRYGHVLFAAKVELDVCLAWARETLALDRRFVRSRLDAGLCPFWEDGRCAVRPVRPLGCRLYFCSAPRHRVTETFCETARHRLADLSSRCAVRWWYGPALGYLSGNLPSLIGPS